MIASALAKPEGHHMIESIEIKNFRGYEQVSLRDLKRINIIVGRSASGKTALLEAIYLTLGVPGLAFKLRQWRGMGDVVPINERSESQNTIWRDFFFRFENDRVASIAFRGSADITRTFTMRYETDSGLKMPSQGGAGIQPTSRIHFQWWKASRQIGSVKPDFSESAPKLEGAPEPLPGAYYSSSNPINPQETASWFSDLSKIRQEQPIVEAIKKLYPFIDDLSVETHAGIAMVHADIPTLPEKIPAGLISSGVNKLISLLVAIAKQRYGVLIVDEIENGFYYNGMPQIWQVLYEFCKESKVQLFASTHSGECLDALEGTMIGHENDFSLIRTDRENNKCVARHFAGLNFRRALEQEIEVR